MRPSRSRININKGVETVRKMKLEYIRKSVQTYQRGKAGGNELPLDPMLKLLADDDPHIRAVASEALGVIKDQRAVEPLVMLLT